ncbi:CHAP domain-containing protein [[Clostridium] scindens]|uniref:CHAP domain-containing protein n=1 Tax=Clostridium scindens (strain JCM 10418 / VPI 12708) TaxID=29347 RepID=UPI0022E38438|nr:CHAP domain-containing protein [[Clostridium] scindens]
MEWFQSKGKWQAAGSVPSAGSYVFFDWDSDGTCDYVGIVESCDGTVLHTIDGNSGDAVKQNTHSVNATSIMGYGIVSG